jgi:NitT/TauT family transport system ATP-binding protein
MDLIAEGIGHRYDGLTVLDDVSVQVISGEILAVIGPSGSGKSTLLRILGGLERPTTGTVSTVGQPRDNSLNPITFVFQDFALLPWRSVEGNVALPLEHHGLSLSERQAMVADALRRTGLDEFGAAYPRQLSGGMRQRVGIARALAVRPDILLMDEPLSALDAQTRELLMDDLVALSAAERFSGIYVTHNLSEATRLASRVVVLSRRPGRIRAIFPVDVPVAERHAGHPRLIALQNDLWAMLRDEARDAERELARA